MEQCILLTGFEPFGGSKVNSAWETVKCIPEKIGDWQIKKMLLPVVFGEAAEIAWNHASEVGARVILCIGQAAGRDRITPEQIGINLRDGNRQDNAGQEFHDAVIIPGAPDGLFTTLPIRDMVNAMEQAGIPADVSYSAGTYVCNDTLYTLLYRCHDTGRKVGFIHVPPLKEKPEDNTGMTLRDMVTGLTAAIGAIPTAERKEQNNV